MKNLLVALILLTGCATILEGKSQNVQIISEPENAKIEIRNEYDQKIASAKKSGWCRIPRNKGGIILHAEAEGYKSEEIFVNNEVNPWFWWNCAWCLGYGVGGIFMIIDYTTDSMWEYPDPISIELKKIEEDEDLP